MGLFDYVSWEEDCPNCGQKLDGFQTKDLPDWERNCRKLSLSEVSNFYTICENCKAWVEYRLQPDGTKGRIEDYEKKVITKEDVIAEYEREKNRATFYFLRHGKQNPSIQNYYDIESEEHITNMMVMGLLICDPDGKAYDKIFAYWNGTWFHAIPGDESAEKPEDLWGDDEIWTEEEDE